MPIFNRPPSFYGGLFYVRCIIAHAKIHLYFSFRFIRMRLLKPFTWILGRSLPAAVIVVLTNTVYAACDRSDVDYYLSKGFTQAQIAALCGQAGGLSGSASGGQSSGRYQDYGEQTERAAEVERRRRQDQEKVYFLQNALSGLDVKVTPRWLEYTRRICLATGNNPDITARTKICPEVRYQIHFKGLEVLDYNREYVVFGGRQLEIKGGIRRKLLHDFKEYPEDVQRKLLSVYKSKVREGATYIPIRRDVPMLRVINLLREYARSQASA